MSLMLRALAFCTVLTILPPMVPKAAAQAQPEAAPAPSARLQALQAIEDPEPGVRRAAAASLGEVGAMEDTDRLVARLRDDDVLVRRFAEAALWQIWSRSGDEEIDALLQRGVRQLAASQLVEAVATFSELIRRMPAFAEGWNKRATAYYLLGQFELSMHDCDEVLKRNRHHFGALAGYGQMYLARGDIERAQSYFERALALNPNMGGVAVNLLLIEQYLEARRRRMI